VGCIFAVGALEDDILLLFGDVRRQISRVD
jgi:hypothetical protein